MTPTRGALALVVLAGTVGAGCGRGSSPAHGAPEVGERAPSLTLASATGGTVSLTDYGGREVLLYFSMGPG